MSPQEWDALPWWLQRTYIDGLRKEGILREPDEDDSTWSNPLTASTDEFKEFGLTVIEGGRK